jgi:hypothetical protein
VYPLRVTKPHLLRFAGNEITSLRPNYRTLDLRKRDSQSQNPTASTAQELAVPLGKEQRTLAVFDVVNHLVEKTKGSKTV